MEGFKGNGTEETADILILFKNAIAAQLIQEKHQNDHEQATIQQGQCKCSQIRCDAYFDVRIVSPLVIFFVALEWKKKILFRN